MADEGSLPKTTVQKFLKELMPESVRMGGDCKDITLDCCNELVRMITSEAVAICEESQKRIMTHAEIVAAVKRLDLLDYVAAAEEASQEFIDQTNQDKDQRKAQKEKTASMTPEDLQRHQEELFRQAREAMQQNAPPIAPAPKQDQGFKVDTSLFDD